MKRIKKSNNLSIADMIKLFGIRKFEFHSDYTLEKKQEFFSGFRKLLEDLGFGKEESTIEIYSFGRPSDRNGEPITTKEKNIKKLFDKHFFFQNEDCMVDVVFGKSRIFLIIATKKDRQQEISRKVQKFCSY